MLQESLDTGLRVRPRVRWGVLTYFLYIAVFYAIFVLNGVDYMRIAESERTLLLWAVAPISGGAVLTITMVTLYGWWHPSLVEKRRLSGWAMSLPIIMMVIAVVNMLIADFTHITPLMWLYLIVSCILVGLNEETIHRGQLIVALRSRFGETGVWLLSTAMFSAFHLPNFFLGVGVGAALLQLMSTFGLGSIFYLVRRSTGSLVFAMLLHGLWDFSIFTTNGSSSFPIAGVLAPVLAIAGAITVPIILRRERGRDNAQSVSQSVG
ncbi:CPBP family intramembrane glutamic endopeptidase [Paenibacillus sp. NPDC057934]|uniref:CPBP family intramembrane glutamic endopeptidase n=1 Tax=Paenibacillus sp. NPDC057934 TaxID=3346282 RepID=UPI0036DC38D7